MTRTTILRQAIPLSLAAALAAASAPALAIDGAGFVRAEGGRSDFRVSVRVPGEDRERYSDDAGSYSLRGGYFFTPNLGAEAFYTRHGSSTDTVGTLSERVKIDGYGVGVIGKYNVGGNHTGFFVGGRAGVAHTRVAASVRDSASDFADRASSSKTTPYVGVGLGFDVAPEYGFSLNYDYQRPKFSSGNVRIQTLTAAVEYRFF